MKTTLNLALVALAALAIVQRGPTLEPPSEHKDSSPRKRNTGHYASVNGLNLYYELHEPAGEATGAAVPLIVLHGGIGCTEMFDPILPALNKGRQVIAIDLQAHGRTGDIDRPLRVEFMADDVYALTKELRIDAVDILGYSLGGGVALRFAIQHPAAVHKLVVVATPVKRGGWYPEIVAAMSQLGPKAAEDFKPSPLYKTYAAIAPDPKAWPTLITKLGELLRRDYDWTKEVAGLKMPVLIVVGDADAVRTAHAVEFFELLGGGKKDAGWDGSGMPASHLAILPGLTHYDLLPTPALVAAVVPFLDAGGPKSGRP
jgi:pimeloyl-ACP methyl ester carboxylesterase